MHNGLVNWIKQVWYWLWQRLADLFGQPASSLRYPTSNKTTARTTGGRRPPKPDWVRRKSFAFRP